MVIFEHTFELILTHTIVLYHTSRDYELLCLWGRKVSTLYLNELQNITYDISSPYYPFTCNIVCRVNTYHGFDELILQ